MTPLTEREHEIARLVASGQSNKEIAAALLVTGQHVKNTARQIYWRLGVRNRVQLALVVARYGLPVVTQGPAR